MKKITIPNCAMCPFYKEENNVYRNGYVGYVSKCAVQDNKELYFTDKSEVSDAYSEVHESCKLENN